VHEPVEDCGSNYRVSEHLSPFWKSPVGGDEGGMSARSGKGVESDRFTFSRLAVDRVFPVRVMRVIDRGLPRTKVEMTSDLTGA
jgi:hypothetical protein